MPRFPPQPDQGPDVDEDVPAYALARIKQLEGLLLELHRAQGGLPPWLEDLDARIRTALDLDPPGFDPANDDVALPE